MLSSLPSSPSWDFLAAPAAAEDCVTVENFSKGKVGEFPPDWKPRKDSGREVYSIQEADGLRFLHAVAKGLGIQAAKQYEWDPKAYPMLAWSWRPVEFPKGSDERQSKTNDSAVSVYAVFPHTPWSVKTLKYIWSAVVPVGTRLYSSAGLTQALVIRSGTERKGSLDGGARQRLRGLQEVLRRGGDAEGLRASPSSPTPTTRSRSPRATTPTSASASPDGGS